MSISFVPKSQILEQPEDLRGKKYGERGVEVYEGYQMDFPIDECLIGIWDDAANQY